MSTFANMLHRRDLVIEVPVAALREICVEPRDAALGPRRPDSELRRVGRRHPLLPEGFPGSSLEAAGVVVLAYHRAELLVLSAAPRNADRVADQVRRLRTAASLPPLAPLSELEGLPPGADIDVD